MKLKEFFKSNNKLVTQRQISKIGTNRFRLTLDKENVKTPHYVMMKVEDLIGDRSSLANGLRQLVLFVMPDLKFYSSDEKTSVFANEWLNQRDKLEREIHNFITLFLATGNAYFEPQYKSKKGGKKELDTLHNMPMPSMVYRNLQSKSDNDYWIIEYPTDVFSIDNQVLKFHPISYVYGSFTWRHNVWGISVGKDELIQAKFLWSKSPYYGNGLISSAIDNEDVAEEILKNWALAAKYRSLSKKIIGFYSHDGESIDPQEIDDIREQFSMLEEEDSLLINRRFEQADLTFSGADNMMQQELEFLRRDSGASLTPNYMTAFSQDSSLATASEAKVPFGLSIESIQKLIEGFLNNLITKNLLECYSFLSDDLELKLGKADLYSRSETFMNISQLYNMRAATFNELRIAAGLDPVEGGDLWGHEPPLDKTTTNITVDETENDNKAVATQTEKMKQKSLKEKYKGTLKYIESPDVKKERKITYKKANEDSKDKEKSFRESLKEVFK